MPLLAVNYHQINTSSKSNYMNGLSVDLFLEHLKFLRKNFELVGLNDLNNLNINNKNYCIITFDDGLSCHYNIVFQLMKEHAFSAAFFVSGLNVKNSTVTQVHKFQYIRSHMDLAEISYRLDKFLLNNEIKIPKEKISAKEIRKRYRYDNFDMAKIKYIINYFLPQYDRDIFINMLFNELIDDEKSFVNNWYLTNNQIKEMQSTFSCIGSHAFSHNPLAKMSEKDLLYELKESKKILEKLTLKKITAVSYPLGNLGAVGKREGEKAKEVGYKFGFTMEREWNNSLKHPLMLARIDCNDLPVVGKSPLFYINKKILHKIDGSISKRSIFISG